MSHYADILNAIDPAALAYDEWLAVGMAIHHEGGTAQDWDAWSQRDTSRYRAGECARKWAGFNGSGVTAGTLVEYAKRQGSYRQPEGRAYAWDETITDPREDLRVVDPHWVEDVDLDEPNGDWDGVAEAIRYLTAVFESSEYVGYVTESWKKEGSDKYLPKKGSYTRTAGELIEALSACKGDIGAALGDYEPECGAWIRFNPLDGQGVKDSNVTAWRYALVESDTLDVERQAAIYQELELPVAVLVHSGGKSLHAIVRIGAPSMEEYRTRVNFLHEVCQKNGFAIDSANRNPSRLSRLPGVLRNGRKQYIVGTNQGKASWEEWQEWIEEVNDSLPDFESLSSVFDDLPPLAPALIDGVLREGHKMLLAGPSKAGKSYLLLQLVIAIAEGRQWMGWQCSQGRVLYINLELDRASCLHRLKALYGAFDIQPANVANIDLWNLRGQAVPMDALAPKLIRRALKKGYKAIIIDPIYKVITGDENAADKMAFFCNQFDRLCTELGAAVIYCHHHSKGAQGAKNSRDRSSGSGVFARDPDVLLDLIELSISEDLRQQVINRDLCTMLGAALDAVEPNWRTTVSQDDELVASKLAHEARGLLGPGSDIGEEINAVEASRARQSAWRLDGTLREFAPFDARNLWFRHPLHVMDVEGQLTDAKADGEEPPWAGRGKSKEQSKNDAKKDRMAALETAVSAANFDGIPTIQGVAEYLGSTPETVRRHVKEHPLYEVKNNQIQRIEK